MHGELTAPTRLLKSNPRLAMLASLLYLPEQELRRDDSDEALWPRLRPGPRFFVRPAPPFQHRLQNTRVATRPVHTAAASDPSQ